MAVTDIIVSPAALWYSPLSTALPDETTVAAGAAWASWTSLGYTLAPVELGFDVETFELEVEQLANPIRRVRTKEVATIETMLAENSAANLKLALASSQSVTTVAAGASQHGFDTLKVGGEVLMPEYQFGFEAVVYDSSNRALIKRVFVYRGTAVMGGKLSYSKKAAAGIPLKIIALADTAKAAGQQLIEVQYVTAWKTS
jgi:hypothetical protein